MADINPVTPEQAAELMREGHVYLDVRSEPEFEQGHPAAALNVPLMHMTAGGLTPNPEFLEVVQAAFSRDEPLIVACKAGGRSRKAAQLLAQAGFQKISDMTAGWEGSRDAFGRVEPGWSRKGLPVEAGKPPGQSYEDVKKRAPR